MATIDRRNILELIGKHRGKYHSCILTCYNFDFSFFEERVLPTLRNANIKNVNVLADGNYLEQAQEMTTGKEFKFNKTYNFLPVYEQGVFHPKIMLLTGLKHGLLIIGSGNITSSGLSTNDEIWGAFHLDNKENENAALFAKAWTYLQTFTSVDYGFIPQKIEWIKKYSPWLEELPDVKGEIELTSLNQSIQFLSNNNEENIYQQLTTAVPSEQVKTLTVISPYFEKKGLLLTQLMKDFNPAVFNCIVDTNSGILPTDLDEEVRSKINFYDWKNCIEDYTLEVNRLHAKLFHFEYADGSEKMLLGSANASKAAMGSKTTPANNAEASVLISRNQTGNWLKELKIKLPKNSIRITDYSKVSGLDSSSQPKSNFPIRILYSELKGNELSFYLNKTSSEEFSLVAVSRNDEVIETVSVNIFETIGIAKIKDIVSVFKVYITNTNGERCSNYSIIHRLEMLLRCNPDPTQEKFDAMLEQDFPEGDGVTALLEFIDYNWADDETENALESKVAIGGRAQVNKNEPVEKSYQTLTAEEFNKVNPALLLKQSGLLTSANVKLTDFLNLVLSGNSLKEADYTESEEQKLLEDLEQKGEGFNVQSKTKPKAVALKEKRALYQYFSKLDKLYTQKLSGFYSAKALTVTPNEPVTIKSISKILIAFQLIQVYQGKKFIIQLDENDATSLKEEKYLFEGSIDERNETIKGFLMNVFGKFLLLATGGINQYDYAILNEKMNYYQRQVFEKALTLILCLNWKSDEERKYLFTLLLNLHYYILPNESIEWFSNSKERIKSSKYSTIHSDENWKYYEIQFLPYYTNWLSKFKGSEKNDLIKDCSILNEGDVIFNSKIGFNFVNRITSRNPYVLDLKREGYQINKNGYVLGNISYGNKYVQYK